MILIANLLNRLARYSRVGLAISSLLVIPLSSVRAQDEEAKQRQEPVGSVNFNRDVERVIRGTVVDAEGQPIDGARLWCRYGFDDRQTEWLVKFAFKS